MVGRAFRRRGPVQLAGGVPIFLSSPIEVDSFAEGILGERDLVLRGVVGRQRHVVGVASVGQFPTG